MSERRLGRVGVAVAVAVVVGALAWAGFTVLGRDDAAASRSPLIGKQVPALVLADAESSEPFALRAPGRILVVNFWAPWCVPCLAEHRLFNARAPELAEDVAIVGIVYQSDLDDVTRFLDGVGRGVRTLADDAGRASIEFGVTGVPETFFVDASGIVRERITGPVTAEEFDRIVAELLAT